MERARRDLSEVYSRLFDHRPVVQAEIRYFVKEFEEKRGFREQRGLENVNSMIEELGSQSILNASEGLSRNIPTVLPRLEAAIQITNRIQQKEQAADQSNQLQASRESRKAEWEAFVKEQHRKAAEVDEEHTKAADWLTQQYAAMEKDLAKFTTF
ncbi:biogenesis of lysosome-related organelles complex 1 subunit 5 [Pristis pectinata]|uniref:biogenesis of lysosome-related organelles complex 1 subunit 5 n=1 Tax=Pristis pectinata TaxID=685728 RepID=UPI00223D148B|nr:biogenesis of lysosome-related organelles complex 1 subunit 5 [Pristis pectinata]